MPTLRAYLELCRLSNLPTVLTNVLVGAGVAVSLNPGLLDQAGPVVTLWWFDALRAAVGAALLYSAGMALNDLVDLEFDRAHRPERPLPSGRVGVRAGVGFVVVAMLAGLVIVPAAAIPPTLALMVCIVLYDVLHKRHRASVLLMGACRGLVYVVAFASVAPIPEGAAYFREFPPALIAGATAIVVYIALLTMVARSEHGPSRGGAGRTGLVVAIPVVALAPVLAIPASNPLLALLVGVAMLGALGEAGRHALASPARTRQAVLGWLAAICLFDAYLLALLNLPTFAFAAVVAWGVTRLAHLRIAGT